jgi:Zn-finger nucleic acid-binding protein
MKTNQIFGVAIEFCTCYEDVRLDRGEIEKLLKLLKDMTRARLFQTNDWRIAKEGLENTKISTTITIIMTSLLIMDIKGKNEVY